MSTLDRLTLSEKGLLLLYVAQRGVPTGVWANHGVLVDDLDQYLGLQKETQRRVIDELVLSGLADWHRWGSTKLALLKLTASGEQRGRFVAEGQVDRGRSGLLEQLEGFPPRLCCFFFADSPPVMGGLDPKGDWCVLDDPRVAETWSGFSACAQQFGLAQEVRDYVSSKGGEVREATVQVAPEVLEMGAQRAKAVGAEYDVPTDTIVAHELFHVFGLPFDFMPVPGNNFQLGPLREYLGKRGIEVDRILDELEEFCRHGVLTRGVGRSADTYFVKAPQAYSDFVCQRYLAPWVAWLLS